MRSVLAAILLTTAGLVPAGAHHWPGPGYTEVTWHAPIPCAIVACPHIRLLEGTDSWRAGCERRPDAHPDSYDDVVIVVPDEVEGRPPEGLTGWIAPDIDYDLLLCRVTGFGSPQEQWSGVDIDYSLDGHHCDGRFVARCEHVFAWDPVPGEVYVMRAFNVTDGATAVGSYYWSEGF